jgi:hypothetical protein
MMIAKKLGKPYEYHKIEDQGIEPFSISELGFDLDDTFNLPKFEKSEETKD